MSSTPPDYSPYQSKFLNFLNRQFIRINDQIGKGVRQANYLVKTGIQTLLYPLYALIQVGRMIGKQLPLNSPQNVFQLNQAPSQSSLSLPDPDKPIEGILNAIPSISSLDYTKITASQPSAKVTETTLQQTYGEIQAVATTLENHHLVLVSAQNKIFDILSPQQQKQIHLLIRDLRVDYWDKKRIAIKKYQEIIHNFPYFYTPPSSQITLKNLVWELMAWVQKSPVAIALNFFGESQIVKLEKINSFLEFNENQSQQLRVSAQLFNKIDQSLATQQKLKNSLHKLNPKFKFSQKNQIENDPFEIKVLIGAAIDYFINKKNNYLPISHIKEIKETKNQINSLNEESQSNNRNITEVSKETAWLSWQDLYERKKPETGAEDLSISQPKTVRKPNEQKEAKNKQIDSQTINSKIINKTTDNPQKNSQPKPKTLTKSSTNQPVVKSKQQNKAIAIKSKSLEFKLNVNLEKNDDLAQKSASVFLELTTRKSDHKDNQHLKNKIAHRVIEIDEIEGKEMDWLEIEAKDLGYEKHFLQTILELLDQLIVWLEKIFIAIWNWFKTENK
jgi:hypothetical protein